MKIKTSIKPAIKHSTAKSVIKFAWFPHRIDDILVWLGRYEVLYVFVVESIVGEVQGEVNNFEVGKWQKVSERVI